MGHDYFRFPRLELRVGEIRLVAFFDPFSRRRYCASACIHCTQPEQVEAAAAAAQDDVGMEENNAGTKRAHVARPNFPALSAREMGGGQDDYRRIRCPPHRYTPLRESWDNIVTPTVEHMKLQIRQVSIHLPASSQTW